MKNFSTSFAGTLATAVLLTASGLAVAQTAAPAAPAAPAKAAAAKPAAPAAKPAAAKPAVKKQPVVNPSSRTNLKSAAKNVAAGIEAAEAAMSPAELAIAERVHVGNLPCELGSSVNVTADAKNAGYFDVHGKNFKYHMFPVATTTGAIRLEDQKAGAVWLQLPNKSMLMNQKLGMRLADDCMSPAQMKVAEAIKLNPPASVLDAPKPVAAAAAAPVPGVEQPASPSK